MRELRSRLRRLSVSRRGVTLVELVVTFALISLFSTGIVSVISQSLRVYEKIRETGSAIQVSDLILDYTAAELSEAVTPMAGDSMVIQTDGTEVEFENRSGVHVTIRTENKALALSYRTAADSTCWTMDTSAYQSWEIASLTFHTAENDVSMVDYPDNVIRVELTIESGAKSYTSVRYVECRGLEM